MDSDHFAKGFVGAFDAVTVECGVGGSHGGSCRKETGPGTFRHIFESRRKQFSRRTGFVTSVYSVGKQALCTFWPRPGHVPSAKMAEAIPYIEERPQFPTGMRAPVGHRRVRNPSNCLAVSPASNNNLCSPLPAKKRLPLCW